MAGPMGSEASPPTLLGALPKISQETIRPGKSGPRIAGGPRHTPLTHLPISRSSSTIAYKQPEQDISYVNV